MEKKKKKLPAAIRVILWILLTVLIIVAAYLAYVFLTYSRIDDNQPITPKGNSEITVPTDTELTIISQNLGFGAYTRDFTFFMDGGKESWGRSKESIIECINKGANLAKSKDVDFVLFQEVDIDSTRSYHVDQRELLDAVFPDYSSAFANNYHSAFLMYPFYHPHGSSNSGIYTMSKYNIDSSLRRSYPISESVSKLIDLDRCYSISRIPTEDGKELVLFNSHMSAYGGSEDIHAMQMSMLLGDMKKEYDAGNYVVCGGDFNDDFTGNSILELDGLTESYLGWTMPFPKDLIPEGIKRCIDYTSNTIEPTARDCDRPYEDGNFTVIVDGFLVSDNVEVTYLENIQAGFEYSDHNPVIMKFILK